MSHHLIIGLILMLPLTAAIGAFALPRAGRWIGLGLMPALVMLTGWLALLLNGGVLIQPVGGWLAPLGIQLRADGLASLLLIASSVVGLLVSIHAFGYFGSYREAKQRTQFFWPLWFFLIASLNAVFLSRDVFNLYVTLELVYIQEIILLKERFTRFHQDGYRLTAGILGVES